jgi:di/tricarboxylate transporter
VVAIFIPIVQRLCRGTGASPRALMMPLSVAALISGMLTLIATAPNLMVNAELARQGHEGFGFFGVTPFGLPMLGLAVVYMLFFARRLLAGPATEAASPETPIRRARVQDWIHDYALPNREYRLHIDAGSPLAGRRMEELQLRKDGLNVMAIERPLRFGSELLRPRGQIRLQAGDVLLADMQATEASDADLFGRHGLRALPLTDGRRYFGSYAQEMGMVEALVPAESSLVGKTILGSRLRSDYGMTAIGLRHGRTPAGPDLLKQKVEVGDTLLLFGFWSDLQKLRRNTGDLVLLNLPAEFDEILPAPGRAPQAVLALAITVGMMVSGILPNVQAALIGCLLMGLFRCVDTSSAFRAISWKTLVLIVGMLPFSIALQRTGGVEMAAYGLLSVAGDFSPRLLLAILFAVTALLGLFISNTATAVLMAPVALAVAADLGLSPYPFAMTVVMAASAAFMTPVSSPVNTLVVAPGNYSFGDFMKVGIPLTILAMLVTVLLVPWLLPPR